MNGYVVIGGQRFSDAEQTIRRRIAESLPAPSGRDGLVPIFAPTSEWLEEHIASVVAVCGSLPEGVRPRARALRWVQLQGAGAEGAIRSFADSPEVVLTNASGVHGIPIAEHLLAMAFAFAHRLPHWFARKGERVWDRSGGDTTFELDGKRALVVGYGAIGKAFAERALGIGMSVTVIRRNPASDVAAPERWVDRLPHPAVSEIRPPDRLIESLRVADFVVNTLPLTRATEHLFGEAEFAAMKPTAYFLNAGRGRTVDEAALVSALAEGRIAGAGLDVFEHEPLPPDSPLWEMEQVIITPHISGLTPEYDNRLLEIFLENLGRFARGEPLVNVVDREAGY